MPFHVVGQHAEEDVSPDPVGEAVVDGPHLEVDRLEAAEGLLRQGEALVGLDGFVGVHRLRRDVGAHHVKPIQGRRSRCVATTTF